MGRVHSEKSRSPQPVIIRDLTGISHGEKTASFCEFFVMEERKYYPSELQDRFIVRFPDGVRDRIRQAAEKNKRSMNAEVVSAVLDKLDLQEKEITGQLHADTWYLQENECRRITDMYREVIEGEYGARGEAILSGFIALGNDCYAFINERNKLVWAHEDDIETDPRPFIPSMWDLEKDNWDKFSDEPHPLFSHDLVVIDQSELFDQNTDRPKG